MDENTLKEMILKECCNDFDNLHVYVNFNPYANVFTIFANQYVLFTKNEINQYIIVFSSINISLETVKKDIENVVKAIRNEIEKAKYRELLRWENNLQGGKN